ncbi:MAG TPA: ABC transporter ATP-binding protein [Nitrososphaera sp.]|nr:ABC transporter ATP-binding protein [Nitrososphaera sp.]
MGDQAKSKLRVSGLQAYYFTEKGVLKAVDSVNFDIPEGKSLGIVGESGCGKSTLGAALMRSMQYPGKIVSGNVSLSGEGLDGLDGKKFDSQVRWKRMAMVFQGAMNALDPVFTVESQMKEILKQHGFEGDMRSKVSEALKSVGLDESVAKRYPHELSGGMKQRVVIAMGLLMDPEILIADEPTTALDVLVQAQIIALLKKLQQEKKISVILITHDLALVAQIAEVIAIMYAGQIVEIGSSSEIYANPKHPYTRALIGAVPRLHSSDKKINFIPGSPPSLIEPGHGCRFYPRCPQAMEACKKDPPEFKTESGYVRCWLYEKNPET